MSISYMDVGDLRTVMISGRMDIGGPGTSASQLVDLTQAPAKVIVDLSALTMLASIGIRALVASAKGMKARGGRMVLIVDASSTVMANLKIAGVDQMIPVFGSARDAETAATA